MIARKQLTAFVSLAMACSGLHAQLRPLELQPLRASPAYLAADGDSLARIETVEHSATQPQDILQSSLEEPRSQPATVEPPAVEPKFDEPDISPPTSVKTATATLVGPALEVNRELIRQRFPDGKPQIERWVIEDAKGNIINHGKFVQYDEQGMPIVSGSYVNGRQEGAWSKVLTSKQVQQLAGQIDKGFSGPFTSLATFKQGQLDGDWTVSDARGQVVIVWTFTAGKRHGTSSHFNSKGEVTQSITYKMNLADGPAKFALPGEPLTDTVFTNGRVLRQVDQWYPAEAGKRRVLQAQEWQLVPMPLNVTINDWNSNRVDYQSPDGKESIRHGRALTFYSNGQRESEGSFDHGQREGAFAWWYANGQQKTVGEYRKDLEHSEWTWWHENGMRHASGRYVDGKRIDEWSVWNPDGRLVQRTRADETQVAGREKSSGEAKNR